MNLIRRSKLIQPPTTELKKHSDRYLQITAASAEFDSAIATLTMGAKRPAGFPVAPGDTRQIMRSPRQAELHLKMTALRLNAGTSNKLSAQSRSENCQKRHRLGATAGSLGLPVLLVERKVSSHQTPTLLSRFIKLELMS